MTNPALMIGLGEVLWDLLSSGKALGGAPANFAYAASLLGDQGAVASRLGNDDLGREAYEFMQKLGLKTSYMQHDALHPTGTAEVAIDSAGRPTFTIRESVSWDFLEWTDQWKELSKRADVVCFGSLAQRSAKSAATIEAFLAGTPSNALRIFDANLRQSFYNEGVLRRSLRCAQVAKLNDEELLRVSSLFGLGAPADGQEALARNLLKAFGLRLVSITRGASGSLLVSEGETVEHRGFSVNVVDTVGAGDFFTACLAHYYLAGRPLREISEFANRFASWVTTQAGATPIVNRTQVQQILQSGVQQ